MKQQLQKIKDFFKRYNIILLGAILFIVYFWNRFLRTKTSKDLPYDLTIIRFFILLNLCIIFAYICLSLIYPRKGNQIIEAIVEWLFIPIMEFDKYLKTIPLIKTSIEKLYIKSYSLLKYMIIDTNLFFIIFWVFPRLILLSALFIDVFVFHQLHYKYMVILFGLLLFFNRYFKFSLKNTKQNLITKYKNYIDVIETPYVFGIHPAELEPDYDPNDPDEDDIIEFMYLPFEVFIDFQTKSIVYQNIIRNISFVSTTKKWRLFLSKEFKYHFITLQEANNERDRLNKEIGKRSGYIITKKELEDAKFVKEKITTILIPQINELINISILLEYYNNTSNQNLRIKNIKILIYLNYLICWLYILIISLHTLNVQSLVEILNNAWLTCQDPFSQMNFKDDLFK